MNCCVLILLGFLYAPFTIAGYHLGDTTNSAKGRHWLHPKYVPLQFAGNIGFLSTGVGYPLFKEKTRLSLLYGFVPRALANKEIHLITMKGDISLFHLPVGQCDLVPYAGLALTLEFGGNSFITLPSRFPKHYYHSNAFHFSGFLGLRSIVWKKRKGGGPRAVELFGETGAQDVLLYYKITQEGVRLNRIFSLAMGMNVLLH